MSSDTNARLDDYLRPRAREPRCLTLVCRDETFRRVLVSLFWIALVILHLCNGAVLIHGATKDFSRLNTRSAIRRTL